MRVSVLCKGLAAVGMTAFMFSAQAALIYQNSAGSSMSSHDLTTGAMVKTFTQNKGNGRGIVVVGDTIYYTVAGSGSVYKRSVSTNADLGVAFTITGSSGLQAISYDGTNFWVGDYSGTTKAYLVSSADGSVIKTIDLSASAGSDIQGYYDGLEYFNGKLIANRYDGGYAFAGGNQYSVYDLNGNLLTKDFINTNGHGNGTGIAFDGTNFYINDIFHSQVTIWDGTTGAYISALALTGANTGSAEDLSVDFAGRADTCGGPNQPPCDNNKVPLPGTLPLAGLAMLALAGVMRRSRRS